MPLSSQTESYTIEQFRGTFTHSASKSLLLTAESRHSQSHDFNQSMMLELLPEDGKQEEAGAGTQDGAILQVKELKRKVGDDELLPKCSLK